MFKRKIHPRNIGFWGFSVFDEINGRKVCKTMIKPGGKFLDLFN